MAYVNQSADKRGAALTIGVHVAIGAAILLYPAATYITREPVMTIGDNIELPKDPPPPPPQQEVKRVVETPQSRIDRPIPVIDNVLLPPLQDALPDLPPTNDFTFDAGGIADLGGTVKTIDPPMKPPVLTNAVRDPRYVSRFQPDYPSRLIREELTGAVKVRVLIGTDGRVKRVEQVSATHPDFFKATERQALGQWRFKPATRDGVPVESWETLTVRFTLDSI